MQGYNGATIFSLRIWFQEFNKIPRDPFFVRYVDLKLKMSKKSHRMQRPRFKIMPGGVLTRIREVWKPYFNHCYTILFLQVWKYVDIIREVVEVSLETHRLF